MASSVIFEERVEIPYFPSLAEFRAWALSDDFPERGRIDYIGGRIEVDMSPENLFFHGSIKTEVVRVLANIVQSAGGGYLFSDRTRVSSPDADLSAEPDVVYLSAETIDSGRVRLVPSAGGEAGQLCGTGRRAGPGRGDRQRQFRRQGHEAIADFLLARRDCGVLAGRCAAGATAVPHPRPRRGRLRAGAGGRGRFSAFGGLRAVVPSRTSARRPRPLGLRPPVAAVRTLVPHPVPDFRT